MSTTGLQDPTYQALSSSDDDPRAMLAKIMSPTSAAQLVGPPPDSPPPHEAGRSTPLTGTLARAPQEAVAKNMDTALGRQSYNTSPIGGLTGVSNPPNGGNVNTIDQPAAQPIRPAQPVQQAQPANGMLPLQPGVPLAAQQANRVQAYRAGPGPAQYAASQTPVRTDPLNPDPTTSLRPAGSATTVQPVTPSGAPTQVQGPSALDAAQSKYTQIANAGSGIDRIQNPIGRVAARIGDIALRAVAPGIEPFVPGTQGNYQTRLGQQQGIIGQLQGQQQAGANLAETESKTAANTARPVTADEAAGLGNPKLEGTMMLPKDIGGAAKAQTTSLGRSNVADIKAIQTAAAKGQRPVDPSDLSKGYEDDTDSQAFKNQQALNGYRDTMAQVAQMKAALAKEGVTPGTPAWQLAQQKIQSATMRGQAMLMNAVGGNKGTDLGGTPLPGALLTDSGQPVGSHFSVNVRPTGQERNKGNMATSADEQLNDIKTIMQKHPKLFGPGYGQATEFKKWLGSQDPDAQRFVSARTVAGDHLAGTFGGVSETALHALDNAIGQFKDNPKAALAGIDQLQKANTIFKQKGGVRTVGSNAAQTPPPPPAGITPSGKAVSLAEARSLAQNKGKSDADITRDIQTHGHQVIP